MSLFLCNVITLICLILLVGYSCIVAIKLLASPKDVSRSYLRGFKKGKFAFIYVATLPLYVVAFMFSGQKFHIAFFNSIERLVNLIVLKYNYTNATALMEASKLFNGTLHLAFVLSAFNTVIFALSIVHQKFINGAYLFFMKRTKKERLYVFGKEEDNVDVYLSAKAPYKLIIGDFDDEEQEKLYFKKIYYHSEDSHNDLVSEIVKQTKKGPITVIINEVSSEQNLALCARFNKLIQSLEQKADVMEKLKIFVFGDPAFEEIYLDEIKRSKGCLRYIDKYHQVAIDFIDKYPFSAFLKDDQIDTETSFVKENVDINVIFIGFGKINKQIFLTSVANNQFLKQGTDGAELKQVDYYIFDKDVIFDNRLVNANSQNGKDNFDFYEVGVCDKNLNHSYYRYKSILGEIDKEEYLPLPTFPSNDRYFQTDVNSPQFYKQLKGILTEYKNSANLIIIALGSDLVNLDIAKKLCSKRAEWGVENCTIFVKNRNEEIGGAVAERKDCYYFGNEKQIYDVQNIFSDKLTRMAMLRDEVYSLEYLVKEKGSSVTQEQIEEQKKQAHDDWYISKSQAERESSIYCALSLRLKLNLIGLDYCPLTDERKALSEKEYFDLYAKEFPIESSLTVDGKKIIKYGAEFKKSKRTNLAILEHYRWNAFMITQGFIPASKERILNEKGMKKGKLRYTNGKNYELRRHGNLTTFEGLQEFSNIIMSRDNLSKEQADVISYDYQIMDDAFWLINKLGMKIVKK